MKNIQNFTKFNESVSNDKIQVNLEKIFNVLKSGESTKGDSSFGVEVTYNELGDEVECYVDIELEFSDEDEFSSKEMDKIYELIEHADKYIKTVNGKLDNILFYNQNTGRETSKKSLSAAKTYSVRNGITSIRVWFDIK
jgi:hypothetical protein